MALQEPVRRRGDTAPPGPPAMLVTPAALRARSTSLHVVPTPDATNGGTGCPFSRSEVDHHVHAAMGGCAPFVTIGSASAYPGRAATYGSSQLWRERNDATSGHLADGGRRVWWTGDALAPDGLLIAVAEGTRAAVSGGLSQPLPAAPVGSH